MVSLRAFADRYRGFQPDARRFLLVTLVGGAALSLWWIDFNLYLAALGFDPSRIGVVAAVASLAGAVAAFPASALSDRIGRRLVMLGGAAVSCLAVVLLIVARDPTAVLLFAALFAAADSALHVVGVPYMTEHSEPEHRSELFAAQFALVNVTNIVAAALGGIVARVLADAAGIPPDGVDTYRIILVFMAVLLAGAVVVIARLGDDRPATRRRAQLLAAGEPARFPRAGVATSSTLGRLGLTVRDTGTFTKILLPSFLISIGAGQVIPFLNLFVQGRFGLDLAALNGVFALTSVGTMVAILFQPTLARRFGRLRSVVLVQGASIPFLVVLGFSPVLWLVIAAMAVRNSLMNAGNPILNAFAMDQVSAAERATLAAAMSVLWSIGWVIGGAYYAGVHAALGFDAGYALNFATIIGLYSVATALYWAWFHDAERGPAQVPATAVGTPSD